MDPLEKMTAARESGVRCPGESSAAGAKRAARYARSLAKGRDGFEEVFDVDGARQGIELGFGEEGARSDDGANAALVDGGLHGVGAGGEVEVHGDGSAQGEAHVDEGSGYGGGEEYSDHFGGGGPEACPTKHHGGGQQFAVGEGAAGGVGHGEAAPVAAGGVDEAAVEEISGTLAMGGGFGGEFLDGLADGLRGGVGRHGRAEGDGHGIGNSRGPLPEEFAAGEAEDAAPEAIEVHGNNGHAGAFDDFFHAAFEGEHVAGAADGAFGEDADDVAGGDFMARGTDGFDHVAGAAARRPGWRWRGAGASGAPSFRKWASTP